MVPSIVTGENDMRRDGSEGFGEVIASGTYQRKIFDIVRGHAEAKNEARRISTLMMTPRRCLSTVIAMARVAERLTPIRAMMPEEFVINIIE